MNITLTLNEWYDADFHKPPKDRRVLCHLDDDTFAECYFNGMYWVGQHGMRISEELHCVDAFLIHTKYNADDLQ